jgi:hypothetical protein
MSSDYCDGTALSKRTTDDKSVFTGEWHAARHELSAVSGKE